MEGGLLMNRNVRKSIEELAGLVRDYCGMNDDKTSEADIMKSLGGRVTYDADLPLTIKGTIAKCGNDPNSQFVIRLSDAMDESEKRLVLFRQIGHLFLHMGYMIDEETWNKSGQYKTSGNSEEKIESDEFALDILMPANEYRKVLQQNSAEGAANMENIAKFFRVPREAAIRRGRRLGCLEW